MYFITKKENKSHPKSLWTLKKQENYTVLDLSLFLTWNINVSISTCLMFHDLSDSILDWSYRVREMERKPLNNVIVNSPTSLLLQSLNRSSPTPPFPPVDQRGVPQPVLSIKEYTIIIFMLLLWAYSIYLTIRYDANWKIFCDKSTIGRTNY